MKYFIWDPQKNEKLIKERNISFEACLIEIENGKILDILANKNYPHQKIFVIEVDNYVYLIPFIENDKDVFLKTIIPSRKFTKKYLK